MLQKQIPDDFFKVVGDTTFELEVYPKFLYFAKVTDKGERLHQKAVVNQKVDPTYLKKVLSSDKLPFQELLVSRKATFEQVLRLMSTALGESSKRGRLWIEDQVISGAKLEESLEDFGISMGQVVYVEYANNSNQWPTDNSLEAKRTSTGGEEAMKTNGLYNLGNSNICQFFNVYSLLHEFSIAMPREHSLLLRVLQQREEVSQIDEPKE